MKGLILFFICLILPWQSMAELPSYDNKGVILAVDIDEGTLTLNSQSFRLADRLNVLDREGRSLDRSILARGQLIQYRQSATTEQIDSIQIMTALPKNQVDN